MYQTSQHIRACYDTVAREYAEHFSDEHANKPMDREILNRFASEVRGQGPVYDLGCGPGQTTAFLHDCGVNVSGLDLSPNQVHEARQRHPNLEFTVGDMLVLPIADDSLAGVVAFYAIVHFTPTMLHQALLQMHRVLRPGGRLLLAFHIGEGSKHVDELLGHAVSMDFVFFNLEAVKDELIQVGFVAVEVFEREPYPDVEYPSRRAYVFASKAGIAN